MSVDVYFSADVETDGAIPGPFSILSFALVFAGGLDGKTFERPQRYDLTFYRELQPISNQFELDALRINGLDRTRLCVEGESPEKAMTEAFKWVMGIAGQRTPVMVAYPLSFDWTFLYWYFVRYSASGSPFGHSRCLDIKTAFAIRAGIPMADSGLNRVCRHFVQDEPTLINPLDDAIEQAEIFANVFEWSDEYGRIIERTS